MSRALELLEDAVRRESGIALRRGRREALLAALARADPGLTPEEAAEAIAGRPRGGRLLERLIDEVAVKETSFFRDPGQLHTIDWQALVAAAERRGSANARVWSVGCATGEEPYTLAMLACDALGSAHPPVAILGTDISEPALAAARRGRYASFALRNVGESTVDRHMRAGDGGFVVRDRLRELVTFERHNLALDAQPPGAFELILCRNVLIYLDEDVVARVVDMLERALQPEGVLMLGAADRLSVLSGAPRAPRDPIPDLPPPAPPAGGPRGERPAPVPAASPMPDPQALFARAVEELTAGDAGAAVRSLRATLYLAPTFALAAFQLGCAYEALADRRAARRAYGQALRTARAGGGVAAASSMRLRELAP